MRTTLPSVYDPSTPGARMRYTVHKSAAMRGHRAGMDDELGDDDDDDDDRCCDGGADHTDAGGGIATPSSTPRAAAQVAIAYMPKCSSLFFEHVQDDSAEKKHKI